MRLKTHWLCLALVFGLWKVRVFPLGWVPFDAADSGLGLVAIWFV